jgi:hypothetical protein
LLVSNSDIEIILKVDLFQARPRPARDLSFYLRL